MHCRLPFSLLNGQGHQLRPQQSAFCLRSALTRQNPVFDYNRAGLVGEEGIYREMRQRATFNRAGPGGIA